MESTIYVPKSKHDTYNCPEFDEICYLFLDLYYSQSDYFLTNKLIDCSYFFNFLKYFKLIRTLPLFKQFIEIQSAKNDVIKMQNECKELLTIASSEDSINEGLEILSIYDKILLQLSTYSEKYLS